MKNNAQFKIHLFSLLYLGYLLANQTSYAGQGLHAEIPPLVTMSARIIASGLTPKKLDAFIHNPHDFLKKYNSNKKIGITLPPIIQQLIAHYMYQEVPPVQTVAQVNNVFAKGTINDVSLHPDGKIIAIARHAEEGAYIWNIKEKKSIPLDKKITVLPMRKTQFSHDGSQLIWLTIDGTCYLYKNSNTTFELSDTIYNGLMSPVSALAFAQKNKQLGLIYTQINATRTINMKSGETIGEITYENKKAPQAIGIDNQEKWWAYGFGKSLKIIPRDINENSYFIPTLDFKEDVISLDWGPQATFILVGGKKGTVSEVRLPKSNINAEHINISKNYKTYQHSSSITDIKTSADGSSFATASGKTVTIWDRWSGKQIRQFNHAKKVNCISLCSQKPLLASGSDDGLAYVWSLEPLKSIAGIYLMLGVNRWKKLPPSDKLQQIIQNPALKSEDQQTKEYIGTRIHELITLKKNTSHKKLNKLRSRKKIRDKQHNSLEQLEKLVSKHLLQNENT